MFLGPNLHEVVRGRAYRCAQLSGPSLEKVIRKLGIRTVVNLRGCCDPWPWYLDECRATHNTQIEQQDINLSAGRLPSGPEVRHLVEVLDRTSYPILIHCKRGVDRTGLVSAVVLLLAGQATLPEARWQLGLRFGHIALGRPAYLDEFFDLYKGWLHDQQRSHSAQAFRQWIQDAYCPGACRCTLQLTDKPAYVVRGVPTALTLRAGNTSGTVWQFRPGRNAGIHLGYLLWDDEWTLLAHDRAGLLNAEVPPGAGLDMTVALPALSKPGRYHLLVDLIDEPQGWFYQTGSEPLETELEVR